LRRTKPGKTLRYRQPAAGQPYLAIVEGDHPRALIDRFAGKFLVICCYGSSRIEPGAVALAALHKYADLFDAANKNFLGVTVDRGDEIESLPAYGRYFFYDQDGLVSRQCGAAPLDAVPVGTGYRVTWTIIDPTLHVLAHFHTGADASECEAVFGLLQSLPGPDSFGSCEIPAPLLFFPNLFESSFCDRLIGLYENGQPRDSGFMRDNVEVFDHSFKRRRDYFIEDEAVKEVISKCVHRCIIPEIRKLFFMKVTRMERYLVGCYAGDENAHFRPHRDNGQAITAHRRFALSVFLSDDFDGGELVFPEYNRRLYKAPKGWGIVFPCAVLHGVTPVTRGRRFVFLPFLYDEAGAKMKEQFA
jgi:2OG-Fe(II) oxygenase superfamily